jgi:ATP-dependent Clp protease ATP-binding subunit ClpA
MELTDRAWLIVQKAQEEARAMGDRHVGSDHLLLAMLRDRDGAGAYVLDDLGITYDTVFERMVASSS